MIDTDHNDQTAEVSRTILGFETALRDGFDSIEATFAADSMLAAYELPDLQEKRNELIANEKQFADTVLGALKQHDDKTSPLVLLFDIDETIVKKLLNEAGTDVMRPAAAPLMNYLKKKYGARLHLGLLSSRGQHYVDAIGASEALTDVDGMSLLDPDYIQSSRDGLMVDGLGYTSEDRVLDDLLPYLAPEIRALCENVDRNHPHALGNALAKRYPIGGLGDPKLRILAEMARHQPDTTYMLVDDLPIVKVLNNNRVHGVSLYGSGRFSL